MSDQAWDLDFDGQTADEIEKNNSAKPDGWYRAKLFSVKDDQQNGAKVLEFQIVHGPLSGQKFREWLNNPKFANSPEGASFNKKKFVCYAKRLGLISGDAKQGSIAFESAVGKEMLCRLHTRKGDKKDFQGMDFDCYPPGHPSVEASVYIACGLTPPPEAPKGSSGANGKAEKADRIPATPPAPPTADMAKAMWD